MSLVSHLQNLINVSPALKAQLDSITKCIKFSKGQNILIKDERCSYIYFIEKGFVRGYYFNEDKEITNWFAQENEFATCFYSFITQQPATESIQAIEDCELVQIAFKDLQELYKNFPETERVGRMITEAYYIQLESRLLSIQFKSAKERYQNLLETRPSFVQRAALGQVASYLGISQETLSRLRADI